MKGRVIILPELEVGDVFKYINIPKIGYRITKIEDINGQYRVTLEPELVDIPYELSDYMKNAVPIKIPPLNTPICPICGGDTDETEHGRQYCYDCKEKLEEKK